MAALLRALGPHTRPSMHLRSIQTPQRRRPYSLCSEAIGLALSSRSKPLADGVCVLATQRTRHRVPEGGVMISPPCRISRSPSKDYVDAIGERAVTGSHCRTALKAEFGSCQKPTPQCPADSGCRRPTTGRAAQPAVEMADSRQIQGLEVSRIHGSQKCCLPGRRSKAVVHRHLNQGSAGGTQRSKFSSRRTEGPGWGCKCTCTRGLHHGEGANALRITSLSSFRSLPSDPDVEPSEGHREL